MAISLSVVLLLGVVLALMLRGGSIKTGPALVAALFGFFLASTGAAPAVNDMVDVFANTLSGF
ncbi:hypothetical protein [Streptomyces sp. Z26]|uniref:hypothetical protein n=1 Tax=Streptomyces TaxID=1883 RepID=UPI000EF144ED|nr:hypothetical protein [Streptomyces sp. Z26]RLL66791.1 hypothetical protein D7M15_07810 [Streptomyces sp. Z26]